MKDNVRVYFIYGIALLIVIPAWEYWGQTSNSVRILISSPSHVVSYMKDNAGFLWHGTWITFIEASLGLIIAVAASLSLILLVFRSPGMLRFILPAMIASQVVPLIVLAPFFVIALGIGIPSKIAMATVLCFFPFFVGLSQGFRLIPPHYHDLLDVLEAPMSIRIRRVYFPLSLPAGMAGLKVSATLSVVGAIVAEFTGSEAGLGRNLFLSTVRLQPELMVASLLGAAALGSLMYGAVHLTELRVGRWYLSTSRGDSN